MNFSRRQLLSFWGALGAWVFMPDSIWDNHFLLEKWTSQRIHTVSWNTQWMKNNWINIELQQLFKNILSWNIDILCLQECPDEILSLLPKGLSYFHDGANMIVTSDILSSLRKTSLEIVWEREIQLWKVKINNICIHILNWDFASINEWWNHTRKSQMYDIMRYTQQFAKTIIALDRNTFWDKEVKRHEKIARKNWFSYTPAFRTHKLSRLEWNQFKRKVWRWVGTLFWVESSLDAIYVKWLNIHHSGPMHPFQGSDHIPIWTSIQL